MAAFCAVFVGVWVGIRGWPAFETVLLDFGVWVGFGGWHAFCVCFFAFGFGVCLLARILYGFVAVWVWGLVAGLLFLRFC